MGILRAAAAAEAATGLALMLFPGVVVRLLLGSDVTGPGLAAARIAGIALLALGISCWPETGAGGRRSRAWTGMVVYNALVPLYLGGLGVAGDLRGVLLWPAVVLHVVVTGLLVAVVLKKQETRR